MRRLLAILPLLLAGTVRADEPAVIARPDAFKTLVNPMCSHCRDEAKRRAGELRPHDRVLAWLRGYSDGGAIPIRFFLEPYRVISDTYGVFVYDPDAGFARGFAPSLDFTFHGWRNGVMVMKHKDGTLYSCLTGLAFDGPKKGERLQPVPTLVSDWGYWLERYPGAVAYHMFDKYQPVEAAKTNGADALKSRPAKTDERLPADSFVLGVAHGKQVRAYPIEMLEKAGLIREDVGGQSWTILWHEPTRTAAAYLSVASPPKKDAGEPRPVTLVQDKPGTLTPFRDQETGSRWDVAGRAAEGKLQGWTLTWLDGVMVRWRAWAAEYPQTAVAGKAAPKTISGSAEFLRSVPKKFATLEAVDRERHTVKLLIEGETASKVWPLTPDAEIKVAGWWGRLDQLTPGARVWLWFKMDRKKQPVAVCMLADELSEQDMHGRGATVTVLAARRAKQQAALRQRWLDEGLPGTVTFQHIFNGEMEVTLDHEAMRWARSLKAGDKVTLAAAPPIQAVVKQVAPWGERTRLRLVVNGIEQADLTIGQRVGLRMAAPPREVDDAALPPDVDRPRTKEERIEWFLASIYCTCKVGGDGCTGHFYTLACCNPNTCGMPNRMRKLLADRIEQGLTDRQVFEQLLREQGPTLTRPHLLP